MVRTFFVSLLLVLGVGLTSPLLAGRKERDKRAELEPQIKKLLAEAKKMCGCGFPVEVMWDTYPDTEQMSMAVGGVQEFTVAMSHECKTPENKKAFCKGVKSLKGLKGRVVHGSVFKNDSKEVQRTYFKREGNVLYCGTQGTGYCSTTELEVEVFDKF